VICCLPHFFKPPIDYCYYFAAKAVAKYCDGNICVSLCLSVSPRVHLRNHTRDLHQICCARCLWPWLVPSPASLQYVMYFRFWDDINFCTDRWLAIEIVYIQQEHRSYVNSPYVSNWLRLTFLALNRFSTTL